jgi:hypothetical protein
MIALLQRLADRIARLGVRRRETSAERAIGDPEQAWRLVSEPSLWLLWMPGVEGLVDAPRPLRAGARYRIRPRARPGRLGFGSGGDAYVQVERADAAELAWLLLCGSAVERYALRRAGTTFACTAAGGDPADAVLAVLDRETAPLDRA